MRVLPDQVARGCASICVATYNGEAHVRAQLDSILAQMRTGDELLVADDASSDSTLSILRGYGAVLRITHTTRAGGVVANFERVLGQAAGDIVVLADQDDVWLHGRLDRLRDELTACDLVLTNAWVTDAELQGRRATLFDQIGSRPGLFRNLAGRNSFVGCCMAFRRSLLNRALPFPAMTPWHDWLLGLLASASGRVRLVDEPLMLYRRHSSNASPTGSPSPNGLLQKASLRIRVAMALAICLKRSAS